MGWLKLASGSFKNVMEKFFQRNGGWTRIKGELAVYYWPKVAGPEIASKVEAIRFREGYIYLQTENAALAHQISLFNFDIIKKYRKMLGPNIIKGIKIKIGNTNIVVKKKPTNDSIKLDSDEVRMVQECVQTISEPDLAIKFKDLMEKHYLHKREIESYGGAKCRACEIAIDENYEYCPCCERQISEENNAYQQFIKKKNNQIQ